MMYLRYFERKNGKITIKPRSRFNSVAEGTEFQKFLSARREREKRDGVFAKRYANALFAEVNGPTKLRNVYLAEGKYPHGGDNDPVCLAGDWVVRTFARENERRNNPRVLVEFLILANPRPDIIL